MKLPNFAGNKKQKELFLSLLLYPDAVDAAVWEVGKDGEAIIEGAVTQELRKQTWEERNEAADKCISTLEEISKSQNIQKVILGLPAEYLTDEGDIKKDIRNSIKQLTRLLELTPIGFVSIYQAIIHQYKRKEGVPPSLILVGMTSQQNTVTLYKVGNFVGNRVFSPEGTLIGHLEDALASYTDVEILPSRILLYGTDREKLEDAKREILEHHWQQKSNFLHFPKADVLSGDGAAVAVSYAGAAELGQSIHPEEEGEKEEENEIEESIPSSYDENEISLSMPESEVDEKVNELEDESLSEETKEEHTEEDEYRTGALDTEGEDEDVNILDQGVLAAEHANVVPVDPTSLGFETFDEENNEAEAVKKKRKITFSLFRFFNPRLFLKKISLPIFQKRTGKFPRLILLLGIPILLIIGLILYLYTAVLPSATVAVAVSPKSVETTQTITLDTESASNDLVVPVTEREESVSGSSTIQVTGKKTVGDPASGTVTIFNKSLVSRKFEKGTVITTSGLDFTLDEDVTIASASESLSAGSITYGKGNVKVTADEYGTKGNLSAGKEFSVSGLSSNVAIARNEEAFTGGTSKELTVVSRADQDALIKKLTDELIDQATESFSAGEGEKLIADTIKTKISEKSFTEEVGAEAKELGGTATVVISGTAYNENDIKEKLQNMLNLQVPSGYRILPDSIELSIESPVVAKSGEITVEVSASANAVPSFDVSQLASQLAGKTITEAEEKVKEIEGVGNVSITIKSSLFKNKLPSKAQNIRISLEAEMP